MAAPPTDEPPSGGHITPIALLSPELQGVSSRVVTGDITITWPFSIVSQSIAFVLAEPDFRLRRERGQVRIEFQGGAGKAVEDLKLGGGDHVRLSLEGVFWEAPPATMRLPGTPLEWQLKFHRRLRMSIERADTKQTETVDITSSSEELEVSIQLPKDVTPPADLNEPIGTPIRREPALSTKRLASVEGDEFASPAFVKRARVSYGALFEGELDIFDQGASRKTKSKKPQFSMNHTTWKYSSRSPSPEKEEPAEELLSDSGDDSEGANGWDETHEQAVAAVPSQSADMVDEACQTKDSNTVSASEATIVHDEAVVDEFKPLTPTIHSETRNTHTNANPRQISTITFTSSPPDKDGSLTNMLQSDSYDFPAVSRNPFAVADTQPDNAGFPPTTLSASRALDAVLDAASQQIPAPLQYGFGNASRFGDSAGFGGHITPNFEHPQTLDSSHPVTREAAFEPIPRRRSSNVFAMAPESPVFPPIDDPAAPSSSRYNPLEIIDSSLPILEHQTVGLKNQEILDDGEEITTLSPVRDRAYPEQDDVKEEMDDIPEEESLASRGSSHLDTGYQDGGDIAGEDYDLRNYDRARSDDDSGSEEEMKAEEKLSRAGGEEILEDEMEDEEVEQGELAVYDEGVDASSEEAKAYAPDREHAGSFGGPDSEDDLEADDEEQEGSYDGSDAESDLESYEEEGEEDEEEEEAVPIPMRRPAPPIPSKQQAFISLLSDSEDEAPPPRVASAGKPPIPAVKPKDAETNILADRTQGGQSEQEIKEAVAEENSDEDDEDNDEENETRHEENSQPDTRGQMSRTKAENQAVDTSAAESSLRPATDPSEADKTRLSHELRSPNDETGIQHVDDSMEVDDMAQGQDIQLRARPETDEISRIQVPTSQPGKHNLTPRPDLLEEDTPRIQSASALEIEMTVSSDERAIAEDAAEPSLDDQFTTPPVPATDDQEKPPTERLTYQSDVQDEVDKLEAQAVDSYTMPLQQSESDVLDVVSMSPPTAVGTQGTQQTAQTATLQESSHPEKASGSQSYAVSDGSKDKDVVVEPAEAEIELAEAIEAGIEMAEEGLDARLRDGKPHGEGVVNEEEDIAALKSPSSQQSGSAKNKSSAQGNSDTVNEGVATKSAKQLPTPVVTQEGEYPVGQPAVSSEEGAEVEEEQGPDAQLLEEWEHSRSLEHAEESAIKERPAGKTPSSKHFKSSAEISKTAGSSQLPDTPITTRSLRPRRKKSASIDSKVSVELGASPTWRSAGSKSKEAASSSPSTKRPGTETAADTTNADQPHDETATKEDRPLPDPLGTKSQDTRSASGSFRREATPGTQSVASSFAEDESITSLKAQLNKSLRSTLPEALPLRALRTSLYKTADVVAVVAHNPTNPVRPKTGPRDYLLTLILVDPSLPPSSVSVAHIFRPFKKSLPNVHEGDVVLLRRFTVISVKGRGFGIQTTDESAWAVFEKGDDEMLPQINGPPVEATDDEVRYAEGLRRWWGLIDDKGKERLKHAGQRAMRSPAA